MQSVRIPGTSCHLLKCHINNSSKTAYPVSQHDRVKEETVGREISKSGYTTEIKLEVEKETKSPAVTHPTLTTRLHKLVLWDEKLDEPDSSQRILT